MKAIVTTGVILLAFAVGNAFAAAPACVGNALTGAELVTLLSQRYVCASRGNDSWKEKHLGTTSGNVEDYKLGPTDPVDPTKIVGTFAITSGASPDTITYNYGDPGGPYRYVVTRIGGQASAQFNFCNFSTGVIIQGTVQTAHC